jgi:hypothetical protein
MNEYKLEIVSKTGGIKLDEMGDVWFNPAIDIKPKILENIEKLKAWKGKKVIVEGLDEEHKTYGGIGLANGQEIQKEEEENIQDLVVNIKGKEHVTYKGLLKLAHKKGLYKFEILNEYVAPDMKSAWVKVRAYFKDGKNNLEFDGIGSSTPDNTNKMTQDHPIELANTRAKGRALRDALNIGVAMLEELKGD